MSGTFHFMASPDGETIQEGTLKNTIHGIPCFDCCHQSSLGSHDKLVWKLIDFQCFGQKARDEIRH